MFSRHASVSVCVRPGVRQDLIAGGVELRARGQAWVGLEGVLPFRLIPFRLIPIRLIPIRLIHY